MAKSHSKKWEEIVASFEEYLYQRGKSSETIRAYGNTLNSFCSFYRDELKKPGPYVSRLQETDFQAYIDYLRSTKYASASTVNRYISGLKNFSRFILEKRLHRHDIAKNLKTYFIGVSKNPSRLNQQDTRRLITSVDLNSKNGNRDHAIIQLLLQGGLRVGELSRLNINDVTLHKTSGYIRISDEKTRSDRTIPINASVRNAIRKYYEIRDTSSGSEPLFISQLGKRISIKTVQYLVKKYLCASGRSDLSSRDLRRHLAHGLYEKTKNLPVVQQVLGHRSIATTARYIQPTKEEIAKAVEDLPENVYQSDYRKDMENENDSGGKYSNDLSKAS